MSRRRADDNYVDAAKKLSEKSREGLDIRVSPGTAKGLRLNQEFEPMLSTLRDHPGGSPKVRQLFRDRR